MRFFFLVWTQHCFTSRKTSNRVCFSSSFNNSMTYQLYAYPIAFKWLSEIECLLSINASREVRFRNHCKKVIQDVMLVVHPEVYLDEMFVAEWNLLTLLLADLQYRGWVWEWGCGSSWGIGVEMKHPRTRLKKIYMNWWDHSCMEIKKHSTGSNSRISPVLHNRKIDW